MSEWQETRRQALYNLLGDLPDRSRPIGAHCVSQEARESYVLEKLVLDLNGIESVPAYFIRPRAAQGRLPVVLYNHAHGGDYVLGKDELLAGRSALQRPPQLHPVATRQLCASYLHVPPPRHAGRLARPVEHATSSTEDADAASTPVDAETAAMLVNPWGLAANGW